MRPKRSAKVGMSAASGLIEAQISGGEQHDEAEDRHAGTIDGKARDPAERDADIDDDEDGAGECGHGRDGLEQGWIYHALCRPPMSSLSPHPARFARPPP